MHIKKGDTVIILSGDDKGKKAKVIQAFPQKNKVLVDGINMVKHHQKARQQGQKGVMIDKAMPISASKVMKADEAKK